MRTILLILSISFAQLGSAATQLHVELDPARDTQALITFFRHGVFEISQLDHRPLYVVERTCMRYIKAKVNQYTDIGWPLQRAHIYPTCGTGCKTATIELVFADSDKGPKDVVPSDVCRITRGIR